MRAAHNSGRPGGGHGAAFLPRVRFAVERMRITAKGRTWHRVGDLHEVHELANQAAEKLRREEALQTRVRPVVI